VHPLQSGILRLKHPSERRPGLPRERPWIFWPRFVWRTLSNHASFAAAICKLAVWWAAIELDPDRRRYLDRALSPAGEDEDSTLDLLTKTRGAKAAVDRRKKVAELVRAAHH
jgi:hypothetical protein